MVSWSKTLLLLSCWLLLAGCNLSPADPQGVIEITDVDFVISASATPPGEEAHWQRFQFPLASRFVEPAHVGAVFWFRARITKPVDVQRSGIYLYRYTKSVDIYLNGEYLGGDSHVEGWDTAAWNHPLLLPTRSTAWQEGDNELLVRLQASRLGGVLAGIVVGDYQRLEALRDERVLLQVTVNQWLLVFGFLVTLLALLLWSQRRHESLYWKFALVSSCWMLITYHMVIYRTPLPDRWWLPIVHMAIDGWIYSLCLFLASWFGIKQKRQFRVHAILLTLAILWHALALLPYWWMVAYGLHSIGVFFILRLHYLAIRHSAMNSRRDLLLILLVTMQFLCYAHDIYALVLAPVASIKTDFHWSQFVFPFMQLVFLISLIRRFAGALALAEELNQNLEARVSEVRLQLEKLYQEASAAEKLRAAEDERVRIYRDLHDDVGSKLLSIAHAGRNTRFGTLASSALESLRDAVARANNPDIRFDEFLQELKEEMQLRLASLGLSLNWRQPSTGLQWVLSSHQNYHLSRIFRELVTNVIRHAGASAVGFDIWQADQAWHFRLSDNGVGMGGGQPEGSGGQNLRIRAEELGATIQWKSSSSEGVAVTLVLPHPMVSAEVGLPLPR